MPAPAILWPKSPAAPTSPESVLPASSQQSNSSFCPPAWLPALPGIPGCMEQDVWNRNSRAFTASSERTRILGIAGEIRRWVEERPLGPRQAFSKEIALQRWVVSVPGPIAFFLLARPVVAPFSNLPRCFPPALEIVITITFVCDSLPCNHLQPLARIRFIFGTRLEANASEILNVRRRQ